MKVSQLIDVFSKLDKNKRIKFQNAEGWKDKTMAVNAIVEQGDVYILMWVCHPYCLELNEGQKLIWYNPNFSNSELVTKYFPDYKPI